MQEIRSSNAFVVTEICGPNKPRGRHYRSLKLGSNTIINAVPTDKNLLQTGVREHNVENVKDTMVYPTPTLSK